jgi:hypothetical protein
MAPATNDPPLCRYHQRSYPVIEMPVEKNQPDDKEKSMPGSEKASTTMMWMKQLSTTTINSVSSKDQGFHVRIPDQAAYRRWRCLSA